MRRALTLLVGLVLALAAPACSSGGSDGAASTAPGGAGGTPGIGTLAGGAVVPTGFTAVTLVVTNPDGSTEELCVWLADSDVERAQGLMYVTDPGLGGKDGMVFVFPADGTSGLWMRNTRLPLSLAYVAADGRVVSTTDMEPCPEGAATCPVYPPAGPYRMGLEVAQGRLDDLGIDTTTRLSLGDAC